MTWDIMTDVAYITLLLYYLSCNILLLHVNKNVGNLFENVIFILLVTWENLSQHHDINRLTQLR